MAPPHANEETIFNAKLLSEKLSKADISSVEIPARFLVTPENRADVSHDTWAEVPVLDFSEAETDEAGLAKKIVDAASECGFFKFINHGVPIELMDEVHYEGQKFFSLPIEEKKKIGLTELYSGYSGDFRNYSVERLQWSEALQFDLQTTDPEDFARKVWPEGDPKFSGAVRNYVAAVKKAQYSIFQLLAIGLGLPRDFFAKHFSPEITVRDTLRWNYYPTCPKPTDVLGASGHTDPLTLTILHDGEVGGLQIMKDGEWKGIQPVRGALVCNVGDILALWTNDRLKSALHRVVVNDLKPRMSTVVFVNPSNSTVISAPSSLAADVGQPRRYKGFTMVDFFKTYLDSLARKEIIPGLRLLRQTFASDTVGEPVEKSDAAKCSASGRISGEVPLI